jgi:hypothetical protein
MDFSWVKDLAEKDNQKVYDKKEQERVEKQRKQEQSVVTSPLVEKIYLLISTMTDEFNKYVQFGHLKIATTRIQKRQRNAGKSKSDEEQEEVSSFTFSRCNWLFGVRGHGGIIEFLELPGVEGGSMGFKFDEASVAPSYKLVAKHDDTGEQVMWTLDDKVMDGQAIVLLCKDYFRGFIEKTSEQ